MAVAYRASTSTGYGSAASRVVNKPTGTASGDILIAWLYIESTSKTISVPSGWINILTLTDSSGPYMLLVYWLRAGGSEPANYTWSWTGAVGATGTMAAYSGCETSGNPYDATPTSSVSTVFSAYPAVSLTTTVANTLLVYGGSNFPQDSITPPTGFSERIDSGGVEVADKAQASAGATGNINSATSTSYPTSTLIALKPPAGGTSVSDSPLAVRQSRNRSLIRR